jgi:hypothetical protein
MARETMFVYSLWVDFLLVRNSYLL